MPISSGLKIAVVTEPSEEPEAKKRAPRTRKADREFSPPELGLRPSRYRLAERLYEHFQRLRERGSDYTQEYRRFYRAAIASNLASEVEMDDWRARQTGPSPVRVRASELKDCSRQVAMRLMGFQEAEIGLESPHWNIAAISGNQLHEEIEIALKWLHLTSRAEFNVKSEAGDFSGRVDGQLDPEAFAAELGPAAVSAILDVKTVGPDDYKEGCWGSKVPGYVAQVSAYAHLTGCTVGVILLVDRGTGRMMDFEWTVDPAYGQRMLARASAIVKYVDNRVLPKPEGYEGDKPSFKCYRFCPFFRQCSTQEREGSIQIRLSEGADPKEL